MEERMTREVAYSHVESYHVIRPVDLNPAGRLFGGALMAWIDEVAVLVARKHAQTNVTTGSVNHLRFLQGAFLKDTVLLSGSIVYVGKTSMDVKVDTYVEHITGVRHLINTAYLTLVALGEDGKPVPVPGLVLKTDEERAECEKARLRRERERD